MKLYIDAIYYVLRKQLFTALAANGDKNNLATTNLHFQTKTQASPRMWHDNFFLGETGMKTVKENMCYFKKTVNKCYNVIINK